MTKISGKAINKIAEIQTEYGGGRMIVTCPECGSEISEKAKFCPKCGLPNAGEKSKEYCEHFAQDSVSRGSGMSGFGCGNPDCRFHGPVDKILRAEVKKGKIGFYVILWGRCRRCGEETAERHW